MQSTEHGLYAGEAGPVKGTGATRIPRDAGGLKRGSGGERHLPGHSLYSTLADSYTI